MLKLCPWLAGVSAEIDAMIPDPPRHRSRQNFTVKLHFEQSYYMSTLFRNRTRTLWCRSVSLKFRATCLRRISACLLFTADHHLLKKKRENSNAHTLRAVVLKLHCTQSRCDHKRTAFTTLFILIVIATTIIYNNSYSNNIISTNKPLCDNI